MYVWHFCNAWVPSNPLDFTFFQGHAFKALYLIFLKTTLTTVYNTNDIKYSFKLHTKAIFQSYDIEHLLSFFQDQYLV